MICQVTAQNHHRFLEYAGLLPGVGAILQANSSLFLEKQALMQFYLCEQGALMIQGSNATLSGGADPEELASMLEFLGISSLKSKGVVPHGWKEEKPSLVMEYAPAQAELPCPRGMTIDPYPPMADVLKLAKEVGIEGEMADNFYSELCTKRNHQKAVLWTASLEGQTVATAGAYAITPKEAYLAGVVTLPAFRKQGIAGALCRQLAKECCQQGRRVTLMCSPEKETFYHKIGFFTVETLSNSSKSKKEKQDDSGIF